MIAATKQARMNHVLGLSHKISRDVGKLKAFSDSPALNVPTDDSVVVKTGFATVFPKIGCPTLNVCPHALHLTRLPTIADETEYTFPQSSHATAIGMKSPQALL
jgi:hypothetical protein